MKPLYSAQATHAERLQKILDAHGSALDSSDTGTGKTLVAAEIAKHHKGPVLIIAPKAVLPTWRKELAERKAITCGVTNYEKLRVGKTEWGKWEKSKWVWTLPKNCLIVWDEAHKCSGIGTKNAKMLIEAKDRFKVLMLSATIASSPTQLRAVGYLLGAHSLGNFWQWCLKNGCAKNRWNGVDFLGGFEHIENIAKQISHRTSRMTIADLKEHFLETQIITEPLDFGSEIEAIYAEMEEELLALESIAKSDSKNKNAQALVTQLRARQRVELLKIPVMVEMAQDLLAENKSVALFVNFRQTLDVLVEKLNAVSIHGGQEASVRENAIESFQQDQSRIIVCNIAAGGVGISLHDVTGRHPRAAIISPSWNEKEIVQVIGRVHRAGGQTPSMQRILFAVGTVEEKVERSVRKKIERLALLNEKTSGTFTEDVIVCPPPETNILDMLINSTEYICTDDPQTPQRDYFNIYVTQTPRPHAEFSPSALKQFEACPSYRSRGGTNPIAEAGTRIHEAVEKENPEMLVEDTERQLAEWCLSFMAHTRKGKEKTAKLVGTHREIFLDIDLETNSTFGTSDHLDVYSDGSGVMYDYKTGFAQTEDAEINSQVWAYTLGVFQKFPSINELAFYLVYPRRGEISFANFTRADIPKISLRLSTIIARAKIAIVENPTEGVCIYCSKQGSCTSLAEKALITARRAGYEVPDSLSFDGTPQERAQVLKLANLLQDWCEATKKEALRKVLEEGIEIKGFRLDHRKTPRGITEPLLGYNALKEMVSVEEYLLAVKSVSIPTLEKLAAERAPKGKKMEVKQRLEDALRDAGALKDEGQICLLKEIKA